MTYFLNVDLTENMPPKSQWRDNLRAWNETRNQSASKRGWFVPGKGTKAHKEVTNWHVNGGIQKKPPAQTMPKTRCPTCGK